MSYSLRRAYVRNEQVILGVVGLLAFLGLWEFASRVGWLDPIVLSSPSRIGDSFQQQWASGDLPGDIATSLLEFFVGFGIAAVTGVILGIAMGLYQNVEFTLDPFIWFLYSAPIVAFYPLLIMWLGFGFATVLAITIFFTVIPIAVNTLAGIRGVDPMLVRAVRAFGGGQLDIVEKVILPGSLPMILAGLRIGVGRALVGVVVGEMFSANAGLGFRMTFYGNRLRTTDVLVPLLLIIVFGVIFTEAVRFIEHRLTPERHT